MARLIFLKMQFEDITRVRNILHCANEYGCIFSLGNLFTWNDVCKYEIATYNESIFFKMTFNGIDYYTLPIGGDFSSAMEQLINYADENKIKLRIIAYDGESYLKFIELYGDKFFIEEQRDGFDYLYLQENLATLAGKKYHSKRNHINAFLQLYDWKYEPLCSDNIDEAKAMCDKWYSANKDKFDGVMQHEQKSIQFFLDNIDIFGGVGGILRVDGQVVAFTCGCKISDSVFDVMYEKALPEYVGAYTFINNMFVKEALGDYMYINREDDMGLEGLRKAKLSYKPDMLAKKYYCIRKSDAKESAKDLFCSAFSDEDKQSADYFVERYFDKGIFDFDKGFLTSMLYLLPVGCSNERMLYVYGAATLPEYRKLGIMTSLLSRAEKFAKDNGYKSLILRPNNKHNEEFYRKNGYEYTRFAKVLKLKYDGGNCKSDIKTVVSAQSYKKIRDGFLQKHDIAWDADEIALALNNGADAPCSAFAGNAGMIDFCAICEKRANTLFIRELFCGAPDKVCNALMEYTGCNECVALIPADTNGLPHTMELRVDGDEPKAGGYTGIALD